MIACTALGTSRAIATTSSKRQPGSGGTLYATWQFSRFIRRKTCAGVLKRAMTSRVQRDWLHEYGCCRRLRKPKKRSELCRGCHSTRGYLGRQRSSCQKSGCAQWCRRFLGDFGGFRSPRDDFHSNHLGHWSHALKKTSIPGGRRSTLPSDEPISRVFPVDPEVVDVGFGTV